MSKEKKEIREFVEKVVTKVITEKKQKLNEELKKKKEQTKKVQTIKENLHSVLKNVNWETLDFAGAMNLLENLETLVKTNKE
jgi:5-methylthioribose kinase